MPTPISRSTREYTPTHGATRDAPAARGDDNATKVPMEEGVS